MVINFVLLILFFILKAVSDKIMFHFSTSIFSKLPTKYHDFWNPNTSWDNKWKNGDKTQGEKFLGSSTIFVMFTDMWHLVKFIQYGIISLILVYNAEVFVHPVVDWFIYLTVGLTIFEFLFGTVFKKKK